MAGTKRDRQRAARAERQAREAALARSRARRRRFINIGIGAVAVFAVIAFVSSRGGGKSKVAATGPTTTVAAGPSQPCVPVSDPLPAGAPNVPVQVGPAPTQLVTQDLTVGTGATVGPNDTVTVNYIGVACSTGKIFDSSYSRNMPATFPLNGVIKGWTDGIPNMKVGGQRLLGIPADQAYGAAGQPPTIGPNEALWFVVEVVSTMPTPAS